MYLQINFYLLSFKIKMKNIYITTLLLLGLIGSLYANANDQHPSFFESAVYNQLDGNMKMAEIY